MHTIVLFVLAHGPRRSFFIGASRDGAHVCRIGEPGDGSDGTFNFAPLGACLSPFVTDQHNRRVRVMRVADGVQVRSFGAG